MRRLPAVLLLLVATLSFAQNAGTLLPTPPSEISGLLDLLDALEIAENAVLSDDPLPPSQIEELRELSAVADTFAAEDLGARARSLLFLAETRRMPVEEQPGLDVALAPSVDRRLVRGSDAYRTIATIVGVTGGSALALSTLFYVLAERDYQRYLTFDPDLDDATTGDDLFQSWRGYDILGLSMGGVALAAGVGLPLLFGLADAPTDSAVPLSRASYTPAERRDTLAELYAERAAIVSSLNDLGVRGPRRDLTRTIGLTVGLVGTVTSFTMFYLSEETYQQYIDAPFSADAEALGNRVRLFDIFAITSGTLAAAGFGTAIGVEVTTLNRDELEARLRDINTRIIDVRTAPLIAVPPEGQAAAVEALAEEEPTADSGE